MALISLLRRPVVTIGLVVLLLALAFLWWWQRQPGGEGPTSFASPYQNTRPGVRYVGDAACAPCHRELVESYHRHPMGRDLSLVSDLAGAERLGKEVHNPFEKFGLHFEVERKGTEEIHVLKARDEQGRVLIEQKDAVVFAIGSGTRGRSYVIDRGGFLFQSPISWYSQTQVWDLSPGFNRTMLAGVPMEPACLFCHCNQAEPVKDAVNRYERPLEHATAIGCERCHGPGELHVQRRKQGDDSTGMDDTIVNPTRLEPTLREAVCEQCHLTTKYRVVRRGRETFDYRPGLPLEEFWSVFVKPPRLAGDYEHASRVEQMHVSRCFQASKGKMGCVSCHDPHRIPAPEERVTYYRDRCLHCHQEKGCSLPLTQRHEKTREDNCVVCHVPRSGSRKAAHVTDTDHRIRRQPGPPSPPREIPPEPGERPLVAFHPGGNGPGKDEVDRDLGLALIQVAEDAASLRQEVAQQALPLLQEATLQHGEDAVAWQARAKALAYLGRPREAQDAIEMALAKAPNRETALDDAANLAALRGDRQAAIDFGRRAVAVNPSSATYHVHLAELFAASKDWHRAIGECREGLRLDPTNLDVRALLIGFLFQAGDKDQARVQFNLLMALKPPQEAELRRWFGEQMR
jgi:Flp pilus assembly protein TadD